MNTKEIKRRYKELNREFDKINEFEKGKTRREQEEKVIKLAAENTNFIAYNWDEKKEEIKKNKNFSKALIDLIYLIMCAPGTDGLSCFSAKLARESIYYWGDWFYRTIDELKKSSES